MIENGWNLEHTYAELPELFYREQLPETAPAPQMVIFNRELAEDLGLSSELESAAEIFAGAKLPRGAKPISQAYAGYQFGHFTMLGDGRAILLGEQIAPDDRRFDVQLKGSGRTAFSRGGDGYAALAPMLREYIISEAMFALGIPTTRSLAVALTGGKVRREKIHVGAVLTRVASSHIRVGTFDYVRAFGTHDDLRVLTDYAIRRHFPALENSQDKYALFLREVAARQASLIAKWQLVGFIHGVMNTDNMAISGETIDYGPCAFMDTYNPATVFSSIDTHGRYAYERQPEIGAWNLSRLADALLPLVRETEAADVIEYYRACYEKNWLHGMRAKLGLANEESTDSELIAELLNLMTAHKMDFTNTFRALCNTLPPELSEWQQKWRTRITRQPQGNFQPEMKRLNPAVIPRNHRVEEALSATESGDFSAMHDLLAALRNPYEDYEKYSQPPKTACGYKTFCGT